MYILHGRSFRMWDRHVPSVCEFSEIFRKPYLGNSSPPPNLLSFELWEIALKFSDSQMGSFEPLVSFLGKIYFHGLHYGK